MDIKNLKKSIEQASLNNDPLIFQYLDNSFLCFQYLHEIAKNKQIVYIEDLSIFNDKTEDIFGVQNDDILYVLNVDKLENEVRIDMKNLIVICKDIAENSGYNLSYVVLFPKIKDWQIEEYMKVLLPGLNEDQIKWLCKICDYDVYRLKNEADKISIFLPSTQEIIFKQINEDGGYNDLNISTIFDFTNAIIKKDTNKLVEMLDNFESLSLEPMAIVNVLMRNFFNIIQIQTNPNATPEALNMNFKQFNAIRYNCGRYKNNELIEIYELLTSIDFKLKNGIINNTNIIDYLLVNILK